jgi:hypothetical protein
MKLRIMTAAGLLALLAACSVQHRVSDPAPTLPALTEETPLPPPPPEEPVPATPPPSLPSPVVAPASAAAPAPEPTAPAAPAAAPAPRPGRRPRVWGRVEITTSVISPSQLMGPALPYSPEYRKLPVFPEKMTLEVSWGLISVGEATLGVDRIVMFNGRPAYHLVNEARSNSFCDTFYPVRDLNESWLDARTLTSLGYSKKIREGHYYRDVWVLYDRDAGTFVERQTAPDGSFHVKTGTIPAQVQDILSSVYYTRAQTLADGSQVTVDVNTPDNWPLSIKVMKRETVKVPLGRFAAVLVEPEMRREGLFIQKGKHLQLWLSDDPAHRLLMMKVEVFFGHITAVLREMV